MKSRRKVTSTALDGASKFVKGDAIASILILVINIVGGLIIGLAQHDLPVGERPTMSCWPSVTALSPRSVAAACHFDRDHRDPRVEDP